MEYKRFSLGIRFAMTKDADLTPERVWALAFARIAPALVQGLSLFGMWDPFSEREPEPAYACVFSGMSNKRAKRLYRALLDDSVLCSYLTAYSPFVQNNVIERCGEPESLGAVQSDGTITGGSVSYAGMRFCGLSAGTCAPKRERIVIATEAIAGAYTPADAARRIMRAAARQCPDALMRVQRISDGGRGTLDTMVAACSGRYLLCRDTGVRYGVLPDRTAVVETEELSDEQVLKTLSAIMQDGYRNFLLAAGRQRRLPQLPESCSATVLTNPVPATPAEAKNVTYASGVETTLSESGFLHLVEGARIVVLGTTARDDTCRLLGATADSIRYHCGRKRVPFGVIARRSEGGYIVCAPDQKALCLPDATLDDAAERLFFSIPRSNKAQLEAL